MSYHFSYESILAASQAANWRIEDIIGGDRRLDFSRPFMPESFARTGAIGCLADAEKLKLNQIRGCGYLYTFGLVEEFILPFVMDHARTELHADDARTRALLQFAGEEAKHIDLFHRFYEAFVAGFGTRCGMIGPAEAISQAVLQHHPLAVGMATLHIEWMTQKHFTESVRDAQDLDPLFKSLLEHHWAEEMQHAQIDGIIVRSMAEQAGQGEVEAAFQDFLKIAALLDGGLMQQVDLDIESLEDAVGRRLGEADRQEIRDVQRQAIRYTYLGSGLVHPQFLGVMEAVRPGSRDELLALAPAFS